MVRYFFNIIQVLTISTVLISCSSTEKKPTRTIEDDKSDSLAMIYDHAKADKRIDAFMKKLHRTRNFNGNVLVAKKGKIIYQNAIGWADYLHRDSLQIDYKFELFQKAPTINNRHVQIK